METIIGFIDSECYNHHLPGEYNLATLLSGEYKLHILYSADAYFVKSKAQNLVLNFMHLPSIEHSDAFAKDNIQNRRGHTDNASDSSRKVMEL